MIRRVRVALKHSNPIYAEEKSSCLMPSLLGAPNTRYYRLVVLCLCLGFFYIWNRREQGYSDELRKRDEKVELVQREHVSVLEKLRVIWLHKKKLESELQFKKAEFDRYQSKIKLKESDAYGYKTKQEQCLRELQACRKNDPHDTDKNNRKEEDDEKLKKEISGLKRKIEELERKLEENENNKNAMADILKEELKQCETKIRQLTGGGAIEHYSQNETAHFQRAQKADEPLFFDRGHIQHHIPEKLLLGRQLAQTLEEAKVKKQEEREQLMKHPQDREVKDQEVNEQPDGDEQDYKEH